MKKIVLILALFVSLTLSAQTTFDINWEVGSSGAAASATVAPGDTVRWTWTDALPHSVTSESNAQQAFDSGILTGMGTQFSFTFTEVGTNDYRCDVHSNMTGTITVEEVLTVEDKFVKSIKIYPNPTRDELNIFSLFKIDSYELHNIVGQRVMYGVNDGNFSQLDVSNLQPGVFFLKITSDGMSHTSKVIIQ